MSEETAQVVAWVLWMARRVDSDGETGEDGGDGVERTDDGRGDTGAER